MQRILITSALLLAGIMQPSVGFIQPLAGQERNVPTVLPLPVPSGCAEDDMMYDWGLDIKAMFDHYYGLEKDLDRATKAALQSRPNTDRSHDQKIRDALLLLNVPDDFTMPPIYTIDDGEGAFAYVTYDAEQQWATAIFVSGKFYGMAPVRVLAGVIAHEVAHPLAGSEGVKDHMVVERIAADIGGRRMIAQTLLYIRDRRDDYNRAFRKQCATEPPIGIIDDFVARIDSIGRPR